MSLSEWGDSGFLPAYYRAVMPAVAGPYIPTPQCQNYNASSIVFLWLVSLHNQVLTGLINVMFALVFHVFRENGYREKAKGDKYDAFTFMVVDMLKFGEFCEFT